MMQLPDRLTFHRVHEHPHRDGVRRPLGPGRQRARQRLPVVLQPRLVLDRLNPGAELVFPVQFKIGVEKKKCNGAE